MSKREFLSPKQVAEMLGYSVCSLARMRCRGTGPRYVKHGKIWYDEQDIYAWLDSKKVETAARTKIKLDLKDVPGFDEFPPVDSQ
jgi:predicted DNA-binding transcriptional regulator AlpA